MESLLDDLLSDSLPKYFTYGTAGFRDKANILHPIFRRIGIIAALRSVLKSSKCGLMITASHNAECDNGVKLIDGDGGMLPVEWEQYATEFVNGTEKSTLKGLISNISGSESWPDFKNSHVLIGFDTRPSCSDLLSCLTGTLNSLGAPYTVIGLVTTPQLHYIVSISNSNITTGDSAACQVSRYNENFSTAFNKFSTLLGASGTSCCTVDCANGVGANGLNGLKPLVSCLNIEMVNTGTGTLNYQCGADFVKTNSKEPANVSLKPNCCYASFDGDADRVVFYTLSPNVEFQLLDGDKITALFVTAIVHLLKSTGLNDVQILAVQTAYANGSSTRYLQDTLGLEVVCTSTGVKHLHREAVKAPIAVYFEANGHGTVLWSDDVRNKVKNLPESKEANLLRHFIDITNATVGDAITDLLLAIACLNLLSWDMNKWCSLYTDIPNILSKASVKDRNAIKVTNADRTIVDPVNMQHDVDAAVNGLGDVKETLARCFIRPSGTEDVVRVYAEAATDILTTKLSQQAESIVQKYLN